MKTKTTNIQSQKNSKIDINDYYLIDSFENIKNIKEKNFNEVEEENIIYLFIQYEKGYFSH